ncbi:hypothetical protein F4818DRAFT_440078 [Hypoxylon cercidicola]|nr:hypothetical protein F4818DRAFT_440078 [Hypoxylon cercidicola]
MAFNTLPTELRLLVWNRALLEEASTGRIVFFDLDSSRVIPTKHLVSPMLTLNRESRYCALKFYSMKLTVARVPKTLDGNYKNSSAIGAYSTFVIPDEPCGTLFLSQKHDIFVTGFKLGLARQSSYDGPEERWLTYDTYNYLIQLQAGRFPAYTTLPAKDYISQIERIYRNSTVFILHSFV